MADVSKNAMCQVTILQRILRASCLLLLTSTVVCCGKQSSTDTSATPSTISVVTFPTQHPLPDPQSYPASELTGQLLLDRGCIRIAKAQSSHMIVWPSGFGYRLVNGQLIIVDTTGAERARVGQNISLSGGEIAADPTAWQQTAALQQFPPPKCSGPFWLAAPDIRVVQEKANELRSASAV